MIRNFRRPRVLVAAIVLRVQFSGKPIPPLVTILGSILLGPPLAFAGYTFLRDDELEPFRGTEVILRSLACGLVFAAIWGAYWFVFAYLYPKPPPGWQPNWQIMAAVVPVMIGLGAVAAQASLELEITSGALNYALYLAVTVLLRVIIMGPQSAHWAVVGS